MKNFVKKAILWIDENPSCTMFLLFTIGLIVACIKWEIIPGILFIPATITIVLDIFIIAICLAMANKKLWNRSMSWGRK